MKNLPVYKGSLTISVVVRCKRCGNDIETVYRKRMPRQDEVWDCPVCKRVPRLRNKFAVRIKHPLVKDKR